MSRYRLLRALPEARMDAFLEQLVRQRAGGRCEYCRMPEEWDELPFHIDHVIAEQHGGKTVAGNLALACYGTQRGQAPFRRRKGACPLCSSLCSS